MLITLATLSLFGQDPTTDLGFIDIKGNRLHPKVRVVVNEDAPLEAVIVSEPISIRCGAARYAYDLYMQPRQCWIRRLPGTEISLTAQAPEAWGNNWRVEWQNCPNPTPRSCQVTSLREDQTIQAVFIR